MTKTIRNTTSALLAMLLTVIFAVAACITSMAAEDSSVSPIMHVVQLMAGNADPETVSGVYVILPDREKNPLPTGENDNTEKTRFTLTGNRYETFQFTFTEPGVYQYTLGKLKDPAKTEGITVEDLEEGIKNYPLTHIFGFKVEQNADGTLTALPYTCEDNQAIFLKTGEGLVLYNYLFVDAEKGTPVPKPQTDPNGKPQTNPNGTIKTIVNQKPQPATQNVAVTTVKGGRVNTGDESQILFWVVVLGVALAGLFLVILIRRRHEDDDESI